MENEPIVSPVAPVSSTSTGNNKIPFLVGTVILALLVGAVFGYGSYPVINKKSVEPEIVEGREMVAEKTVPTGGSAQSGASAGESDFCKEYGTFPVPMSELLDEYITGPGETLRDIARSKLGDETRAVEMIDVNPGLARYEVDDELPIRLKVYLPNEKYRVEGVTAYMKTRGNIDYNETKPMFGVNAPNSGTGPFIISDEVKGDLADIQEGECVEVVYGSRGYDPQKVVFGVTKQE